MNSPSKAAPSRDPELQATVRARVLDREAELRAARLGKFVRITVPAMTSYWALSIIHWIGFGIIVNSLALAGLAWSMHALERDKHSSLGAKIFLLTALGVLAASAFIDGQLKADSLFILPLPVVSAAFLMGRKWAYGMAIGCVLVLLSMWGFSAILPLPKLYPGSLHDRLLWRICMIAIFSGIAIVTTRSARDQANKVRERAQTLKKAREGAEVAGRTKQAFLANMSHEIRTPLNGILGLAAQLDRPGHAPQDAACIQTMRSCANELLRVLNDVLDLSKLQAGQLRLRPESFSLEKLLRSLSQDYAPQVQRKGLQWAVRYPEQSIFLHGDYGRIRQVLDNFLENALKFSEQGTISLTCELQSTDRDFALLPLTFIVQDQGQGLNQEELAQLRRRISGQPMESDAQDENLGLGLVLCQGLVEMMGGSFAIESEEGLGTRVSLRVELPRVEGVKEACADAVDFRNRRVLVVDDSAINRKIAKLHLEGLGIVVQLADSGEAAIACCQEQSFDLVMMDLRMPGIDGVETVRRMRFVRGVETLPIVALTAEMDEHWERRCKDVGMNDYLIKPFHPDALRACLQKNLAQSPELREIG